MLTRVMRPVFSRVHGNAPGPCVKHLIKMSKGQEPGLIKIYILTAHNLPEYVLEPFHEGNDLQEPSCSVQDAF